MSPEIETSPGSGDLQPPTISNETIGFSDGRKQFSKLLCLNIPHLTSFDVAGASDLAQRTFSLDQSTRPLAQAKDDLPLTRVEFGFVSVCCSIAMQLLVDSGLPCFDHTQIVSVKGPAVAGEKQVVVRIPFIERTPPHVYLLAFAVATDLSREFGAAPRDTAKIARFCDRLEADVLNKIRQDCQSGPNCIFLPKAAFDQGIQVLHLGESIYQIGTGSQGQLVSRSQTQGDAAIGVRVTKDKWTTLGWLRQSGVPTPRSYIATRLDRALTHAKKLGYPVVVKPVDRDRSEGVTIDVQDDRALETAFLTGQKWSKEVLIEERVPGVCHRLVTFRNKFVFAFTRHPKAIVGDGATSVAGLVTKAEEARSGTVTYKKSKPFLLDETALECLTRQGLGVESVPDKEQLVFLRHHNTPRDGGHNEVITETIHPENIKLAEKISGLFRLESMGLDFISENPSQPWFATGGRITEVNAMPEIGNNSARAFIAAMFPSANGAIPVHCFVGDQDALSAAKKFRATLAASGTRTALTSHDLTLNTDGEKVNSALGQSLFMRVGAALRDPEAQALVTVVQTDEIFCRGRPMLDVQSITTVNHNLTPYSSSYPDKRPVKSQKVLEVLQDGLRTETETRS